jgi:serine/threonine-protein kinase ULK/ATG1
MEKIKTKTLSDFKIIEYELGRGTMGRVLLGQWLKEPKTYIAVKEINIKTLEDNKEKQIGNEIMNMLKLESSPYIVQLYSYARTENHLYLFLEFCEDGDLKSYIEKRNGKLSESEAVYVSLRSLLSSDI